MGLIRGMARTAVVAGTATAVSGRVARRQNARWEAQEAQAAPPPPPPPAPVAAPVAAAAPVPSPADATMEQLERLASMHAAGVLADDEFAAAKARLLGL